MSRFHRRAGWRRASWQAKVRAGFRCEECGRAGALQTHHVTPRWRGGGDEPGNLVVLCKVCHLAAHRRQGTPEPGEVEVAPPKRVGAGLSKDWRRLIDGL